MLSHKFIKASIKKNFLTEIWDKELIVDKLMEAPISTITVTEILLPTEKENDNTLLIKANQEYPLSFMPCVNIKSYSG